MCHARHVCLYCTLHLGPLPFFHFFRNSALHRFSIRSLTSRKRNTRVQTLSLLHLPKTLVRFIISLYFHSCCSKKKIYIYYHVVPILLTLFLFIPGFCLQFSGPEIRLRPHPETNFFACSFKRLKLTRHLIYVFSRRWWN